MASISRANGTEVLHKEGKIEEGQWASLRSGVALSLIGASGFLGGNLGWKIGGLFSEKIICSLGGAAAGLTLSSWTFEKALPSWLSPQVRTISMLGGYFLGALSIDGIPLEQTNFFGWSVSPQSLSKSVEIVKMGGMLYVLFLLYKTKMNAFGRENISEEMRHDFAVLKSKISQLEKNLSLNPSLRAIVTSGVLGMGGVAGLVCGWKLGNYFGGKDFWIQAVGASGICASKAFFSRVIPHWGSQTTLKIGSLASQLMGAGSFWILGGKLGEFDLLSSLGMKKWIPISPLFAVRSLIGVKCLSLSLPFLIPFVPWKTLKSNQYWTQLRGGICPKTLMSTTAYAISALTGAWAGGKLGSLIGMRWAPALFGAFTGIEVSKKWIAEKRPAWVTPKALLIQELFELAITTSLMWRLANQMSFSKVLGDVLSFADKSLISGLVILGYRFDSLFKIYTNLWESKEKVLEERVLEEWWHEEDHLKLVQRDHELFLAFMDPKGRQVSEQMIMRKDQTLDELTKELKNSALIKLDGRLQLKKIYYQTEVSGKKVSLVSWSKGTIWHIVDLETGKVDQIPFDQMAYWCGFSSDPKKTAERAFDQAKANYQKEGALGEMASYFMDPLRVFNVRKHSVCGCYDQRVSGDKNDLVVKVTPKCVPSRLDPAIKITPGQWGVTVICHTKFSFKDIGNHAQIILEGYKDGEYVMKMAHLGLENGKCSLENQRSLTGPGIVEIKELDPNRLTYASKDDTRLVSDRLVQRMVEEIERESRFEKILLNGVGSSSMFSGDHEENCYTWARKKLQLLEIELPEQFIDCFAAVTQFHTK